MNSGVFQNKENDCGPAALATILKIFKKNVPLYKVKRHVIHESAGASIWDISRGAEAFDLEATALTGDYDELKEAIKSKVVKFPCIAHVIKEDEQYHFIVILKQRRNKYVVFDPSQGQYSLTEEQFVENWTGSIVTFEKLESFTKIYKSQHFIKSISMLTNYKKFFFLALFLTVLVGGCSILTAKFYQIIIDTHVTQINQSRDIWGLLKLDNIKVLLFSFVCLMMIQNFFSMLIEIILTKTGSKIEKYLNFLFYNKTFSLPLSFYQERRTGDFITRLQDIETMVTYLSTTVLRFITNIIMGIIGVVVLSTIQFQLFLIILVGLFFYLVTSLLVIPKLSQLTRALIEKRALLYSRFKENIDTIESIKIIQKESFFEKKLRKTAEAFIKLKKDTAILISSFNFVMNNLEDITNGAILFFGILLIMDKQFTLGGFLSFQTLTNFLISPIKDLISIQSETQEFLISSERVEEFSDAEPENYNTDPQNNYQNNDILFKNVLFSYKERANVLTNFSREIKEGAKVYIEGKNGSGKTTLVKLLAKIITPTSGEIYIGNCSYDTLSVNSLRDRVTYSTQDNYIFKGTLKENLFIEANPTKRQQEITDDLVSKGILANILSNFKHGWETQINEKGTNLSEGQKQIIGICRLLIIGSPVMIFDESLSKIDKVTQEKIIDFIFERFSNHTCIFIDHGSKMKERCSEVIKLGSY